MEEHTERPFVINREWLLGLALVVVLFLTYSSIFLSDYLMNDEMQWIGSTPTDLYATIRYQFFFFSRALTGVFRPLVYGFIGYDPARVQLMRFVHFALLTAMAVLLFRFITRQSRSSLFAFLLVLLLFAQTSIQGVMGYSISMLTVVQPALWLSLLAFYVYFSDSTFGRFPIWLRGAAVFVILMLAMQSTQVTALFAVVPLSYLTLTDWPNRKKRILTFLGLSALVLVVSTVVYKLGLDYWHSLGEEGYYLGEAGLTALTRNPVRKLLIAVNPFTYWSAFKLWSFPFPFQNTPPLGDLRRTMGSIILGIWILLLVAAAVVELRRSQPEDRKAIVFKWLAILPSIGFGALMLLADSGGKEADHRSHITLTLAGVALFTGGYSLRVLASRFSFLSSRAALYVAFALVIYSCFGAQANVLRAVVMKGTNRMAFIRMELFENRPNEKIIVIRTDEPECMVEPCDPWMGTVRDPSILYRGSYRYALASIGESPDAPEIPKIWNTSNPPEGSTVIDWKTYVALYSNYYRRATGQKP